MKTFIGHFRIVKNNLSGAKVVLYWDFNLKSYYLCGENLWTKYFDNSKHELIYKNY